MNEDGAPTKLLRREIRNIKEYNKRLQSPRRLRLLMKWQCSGSMKMIDAVYCIVVDEIDLMMMAKRMLRR